MEGIDKRFYPRSNIELEARVKNLGNGKVVTTKIHDLSASGLSFVSDSDYLEGAELELELHITELKRNLLLRSRVVRNWSEHGKRLCSVRLFSHNEDDFIFLLDYSLEHYENP